MASEPRSNLRTSSLVDALPALARQFAAYVGVSLAAFGVHYGVLAALVETGRLSEGDEVLVDGTPLKKADRHSGASTPIRP